MEFKKIRFTSYKVQFSGKKGFKIVFYRKKNRTERGATGYHYDDENYTIFHHAILPLDLESLLSDKSNYIKTISNTFSLFIFNKKENSLEIVSDKFGLQTIYYHHTPDEIQISNLIFHLRDLTELTINKQGLFSYLSFGFNAKFQPTIFNDLKKIKSNTINLVDKHINIKSDILEDTENTFDSTLELPNIIDSLKKSISKIENPFMGVTSGLDSSLLSSLFSNAPIQSGNFGDTKSSDVNIGKKIAERSGYTYNHQDLVNEDEYLHYARQIAYYTSGLGTSSYVDMLKFVSNAIPNNFCFVMGEGGECVRDFFDSKTDKLDTVFLKYFSPVDALKNILTSEFDSFFENYPEPLLNNYNSNHEKYSPNYYLDFYRDIRMNGNFSLRTSILQSEIDKFSPFLEKEFIKEAFNLDINYYKNSWLHKEIIKHNDPELLSIISNQESEIPVQNWNERFSNNIGKIIHNVIENSNFDTVLPLSKENILKEITSNIEKPTRTIFLLFRLISLVLFIDQLKNGEDFEEELFTIN